MAALVFLAGLVTCGLGFAALSVLGDPAIFQGALTLGGAWIICALFTLKSRWHGIAGAGVLALLGAGRTLTAPARLPNDPTGAPLFQCFALAISLVVLIATVRCLLAERTRRQIESLHGPGGDAP